MIIQRPEILSGEWMLIGSQKHTGFGDRIDLLAIAPDASLVQIERKRDPTPREVVAQALDYAAWVEQLTADRDRKSGLSRTCESVRVDLGGRGFLKIENTSMEKRV